VNGERRSDPNIIELDDPGTLRQRLAGAVVILVFLSAMLYPLAWGQAESQVEPATPVSHQSVVDLCARWNVPDFLQPVANAAYPSWKWVCGLTQ